MQCLVTGGSGFIGKHLVNTLFNAKHAVKVLDLKESEFPKNVEFIKGDIRDFETVNSALKGIDVVFHLAALTSVQDSIENPLETADINVTGTINILNSCVLNKVKRLVFSSSAAVYDLKSPYGASKLSAENFCTAFYNSYGLETVILRYFNVYGPGAKQGVIKNFLDNLSQNKELLIYGDGSQTRDFVYVKDVVKANILAMNSDIRSIGKSFDIGSGISTSINYLVKVIKKVTGKTPEFKVMPARKGEITDSRCNLVDAKRVLGYVPVFSLEEGIKEYLFLEPRV